jgi:trimeric autotransporter adhesin
VYRTAARAALIVSIVTAAACEKVALLAPTGSTVTLSVSSTTLGANGTAEVVATVIEAGGTPAHNGTEVRFQSSVGVVEPSVARTEGGVARAVFRANGASGTARVVAFSGGARSTEVEVRVGSAAAEAVSVRTTPSSVPQTGGTVQVIASVRDSNGSPLTGAQVVFTTDNGTLSTGNALTDEQGEARATLTTSRETNVRASVAGKEGTARVTVVNLPTSSISVSPPNPAVGAQVTITVTPGSTQNGNPVRNVTVDFGDGDVANLGAITSATPVQHVYTRAGAYNVTVTTTDTSGQATSNSTIVNVQPAAVAPTLTASPNPVDAGAAVSFSVAVSNPTNVPLTGVRVDFGDGSPSVQLGPAGGTAQKIYNSPGTFTATATATDQVGNQYRSSTQVTVRPRPALQVTLDAAPTENQNAFSCTASYPKTCTTSLSAYVPPPGASPGVRVVFTAAAGGFTTVASYIWDLNGDGIADRTTSSNSTDFVYVAPGEYVVRVRVTTTDGNAGEQYLTLRIIP